MITLLIIVAVLYLLTRIDTTVTKKDNGVEVHFSSNRMYVDREEALKANKKNIEEISKLVSNDK